MLMYGFLAMIALFALRTVGGWRAGVFLAIVVAAAQDPIRKMIPGTPGWLALATAPIILAMIIGSRISVRNWWAGFFRAKPLIAKSLLLLAFACLPPAIISATYGAGSWMLTVFGAFSYALIFMTMIVGFHLARRPQDVTRVLAAYCLIHGAVLSGALIEYYGLLSGWPAIGADALGYEWRRDVPGYVVQFISGFYRSADVMGWHAAAVACLSIVLALSARGHRRYAWLALCAFAVFALLLCGRRKFAYMLPLFAVGVLWIYISAGRAGRVMLIAAVLSLPLAATLMIGDWMEGEGATQVRYYTETRNDTWDRMEAQGISTVITSFEQSGILGEGLGFASPGSQHIKAARPRIWQESGPSRLMVELGLFGFISFLLVMLAIAFSMWKATKRLLRERSPVATYAAGLIGFFVANAGSLTVSAQILADPFIGSFLGLLVGVALSLTRPELQKVPERKLARKQRYVSATAPAIAGRGG